MNMSSKPKTKKRKIPMKYQGPIFALIAIILFPFFIYMTHYAFFLEPHMVTIKAPEDSIGQQFANQFRYPFEIYDDKIDITNDMNIDSYEYRKQFKDAGDKEFEYDSFKYRYTDKGIEITDYTGDEHNIIIPTYINGFAVTRLNFNPFEKGVYTMSVSRFVDTFIGKYTENELKANLDGSYICNSLFLLVIIVFGFALDAKYRRTKYVTAPFAAFIIYLFLESCVPLSIMLHIGFITQAIFYELVIGFLFLWALNLCDQDPERPAGKVTFIIRIIDKVGYVKAPTEEEILDEFYKEKQEKIDRWNQEAQNKNR